MPHSPPKGCAQHSRWWRVGNACRMLCVPTPFRMFHARKAHVPRRFKRIALIRIWLRMRNV